MTMPMPTIEQLRKLRSYLLESIAQAADEIAKIDCVIEAMQMGDIEDDLIQAAEAAKV
jgi:hypothetical protein